MTNIILIGPPGAGKGTQAEMLKKKYQLPTISTGQILRNHIQNKTSLGLECKKYIENGQLVPDAVILNILKQRFLENDCNKGFILDGFPRTFTQAQSLEHEKITIDAILYFHVSDEVIIKRLSGRWMHPASGRTYHEVFNPPKNPGHDDQTGEKLIQRNDDTEESVKNRLLSFKEETKPVLDYYAKHKNFMTIEGTASPEKIFLTLENFLNGVMSTKRA